MEGTYPLIIEGEICGDIVVKKQGGLTVFSARCAMRPGILRLSVYGEGKEGYLGVMAPSAEGWLSLEKKLSRSAMAGFPGAINHGAPAGEKPLAKAEEAPAMAEIKPPEKEPAPPKEEAEPEALPEDGLCWYSSPDGALVCFDGEHSLVALPVGDERIPPDAPGQRKTIEGLDYVVYITKDGRIVKG